MLNSGLLYAEKIIDYQITLITCDKWWCLLKTNSIQLKKEDLYSRSLFAHLRTFIKIILGNIVLIWTSLLVIEFSVSAILRYRIFNIS